MQKLSNKILALVIVLIMLAINIIPSTVQAAEEIQNASTKEPNVEFDAKVNGAYEVQAQIGEEIELEFDLKVFKEGSIKNALVSIENNNYSLIESSMENFNGLTADGELKLQDITGEDQKVAKVKAKFNKGETNKKSDFNKESKITFSAVYTNELGKEKRIEKIMKLKVDWQVKDVETELYQELVRYIKYDNKTMITYRINEQVKNNKIPVKKNYLQTIIPQVNKSKPSQISVIGDYDEYKEEDGVLVITKDYSKLTEEQIKNKEEAEYDWKTEESYIVTYIYDAQEDIKTITATSKMDIETILDEKLENSVTIQNDVTTEVGKLIELDLEGTPKLSKGYMYTNLVRENKLKTEFNTAYKINVSTKDVVDSVVLKEMEYKFNDVRTEIINTKVTTHKEELEKVLGENGEIIVTDAEGNELGRLNKDKESIDINAHEIYFETSKPEAEGILTINVDKKIDDGFGYTREDINAIKTLSTKTVLEGYLGDNVISSKEFETKVEMEEPVSSADIAMEPRVLSTMVENQEVEIDVRLNNAKAQDALFTDPIIQIELPEQVKNIDIKSADIIYEKELVPAEIKVEGNVIRATLTGTQTQYNDDGIINGSIIRINTNMTLDNLATSSDEKVILRYGNSATREEGVRELDADVEAPTDFIMMHGLQLENTEIVAFEEEKAIEIVPGNIIKKAKIAGKVINNLRRNADDFAIIGKIPTEGMCDLDGNIIGTTENTFIASEVVVKNIKAKIYYSDNVNESLNGAWSESISNSSRAFKIVPEEEVPHAKEIEFSYEIVLPTTLEKGEDMIASYGVLYGNNAVSGEQYSYINAKTVGIYTESDDTLKISMDLKDAETGATIGDDVYVGQKIEYTVTVTNNGKSTLNNVKVDAKINKDELAFVNRREKYEGTGIYEQIGNTDEESRSITFDQIKSNETVEQKFLCRVVNYPKTEYIKSLRKKVILRDYADLISRIQPKIKEYTTGDGIIRYYIVDEEVQDLNLTEEERSIITEYLEYLEQNNENEDRKIDFKVTANYNNKILSLENEKVKKYNDLYVDLTSTSPKVVGPQSEVAVNLDIYNSSGNSREFNLKMRIPENFEISKISTGIGIIDDISQINNYITNNEFKMNSIDITSRHEKYIPDRSSEKVILYFKSKDITRIRVEEEFKATIECIDDDLVEYPINSIDSNKAIFIIEDKSVVEATQTVNVDSNIKDTIEQIRFEIKVKSESDFEKNIHLENSLIEGVDIYDAIITKGNETRGINFKNGMKIDFHLDPRESAIITIYASPKRYEKGYTQLVKNKPTIYSQIGDVNVNEVAFNIEGTYEGGDDEEINPPPDNEEHSISGVVWIDENNNGLRDNEEVRCKGNLVRLYSNGNIVKSVETDEKGEYRFNNIKGDGETTYYVLIDFDTTNYRVTPKIDAKSTSVNNDFTEEYLDDKLIASSSKIIVVNKDIYNIDLGLVAKNTFDFKLDKYITNVTITNPSYDARRYKFVNCKYGKVEVPTKDIENTTVIAEYKIVISNIGKESGYVKNIVDNMPAGTEFNSELNPGWYLAQDGKLYSTSFINKEIGPGEKVEIKLFLTRRINGENLGTISNSAEIYELYNVKGYEDANSTPGNNEISEDDMDIAELLILASTGKEIASIMVITLSILIIIALATIAVKKEVIDKNMIKEDIVENEIIKTK